MAAITPQKMAQDVLKMLDDATKHLSPEKRDNVICAALLAKPVTKGTAMKKHTLTYIDLYPTPVEREPAAWVIWAGAALALAGVYIVIILSTLWS